MTPTKREEFLNETNKIVSESPLTSTPKSKGGLQSFDLKPAGSAFVKEYTYVTEDDSESRRAYSPRDHGFTYMEKKGVASGGDISPISKDELPSPSSKRLTALAFTYKPPEKEKQAVPSDGRTKSPPQTKVKSDVPPKDVTAIERTKMQIRDKGLPIGQTVIAAPKQSKLPVKSSPTFVQIESVLSDKQKRKEKSGIPSKSKVLSQTSPKSVETGRTSRQSKDSKLESSSSASSISSGSSMDEYEREAVKQDPTITASPVKIIPKMVKTDRTPEKSRIVSAQPTGPKITHASRKRVVTNADGTVEEMEEVLEPHILGSISTSKPVIIGVVPSAATKTRTSTADSVSQMH